MNSTRGFLAVFAVAALTGCGSSADLPRPVPPKGMPALLVELVNNQPAPLAGSVIWEGTNKAASIPYRGKSQFLPNLTLRFASPSGFGLFAEYANGGTYIPVTLPEGCDDGGGDLKQGCYGQLGLVDFEKDGDPDVVVAIGDGLISLHVDVFRYHPPSSADDVSRSENWELIGSFEGQTQARISDTKVELPVGSQGAGNEFVFVQNKFLDYNGTAGTQATDRAGPAQRPAKSASPAAPVRTFYTVASGAPVCTSFKGAITAASVMRSGNPMAIDAVLTRQGCEINPSSVELEFGSSVQELQAGVMVINTPAGAHLYTTGSSITTNRH